MVIRIEQRAKRDIVKEAKHTHIRLKSDAVMTQCMISDKRHAFCRFARIFFVQGMNMFFLNSFL